MSSDSFDGDIDSALESAVAEQRGQPADAPKPSTDAKPAESSPLPATTLEPRASGSDVTPDRKADAPPIAAPASDTKPKEPNAPPQEEWPRILQTTRDKTARETETRFRQEFGIPQGVDAARVKTFVDGLHNNPIGLLRQLQKELAPYLPENQPATKPAFTKPSPRLRAEDGTAAYAAEDVDAILEHFQAQLDQRLAQSLEPINADRERQASEAIWNQAWTTAGQTLKDAEAWEGFAELKPEIVKLMEADGRVTFESAYNRLYQPWRKEQAQKLKETTRQELLKEIKSSPAVEKSIRPGAPVHAADKSKRGRSFNSDLDAAVEKAFAQVG